MKLTLLFKRQEVDTIYSFWFEPAEPVTWIAGQSIRLEIPTDFGMQERRFSIVSAPYEKNIAIATRISNSLFKQALASLPLGSEIDGYNIEGTFVWEEAPQKRILLASGVGITPYFSMLKQRHYEKLPFEARLIYASQNETFLFGDELRELQVAHSGLELEFLAQQLTHDIIKKNKHHLANSLVYLSGSETMINTIEPFLLDIGVKDTLLKRDIFTGRTGWED